MADRLTDIRDLFAYDAWASRRMLEAASGLTPEQLTRDVGGSFPSVLATLGHILHANWIWLSRWNGVSPSAWPEEWTMADYASLSAHWRRIEQEREEWLGRLRDEDLERVIEYRSLKGDPYRSALHEMLRHVVNHATYHRGQVTNHLRALGARPVATDLIAWYRERATAVAAHPLRV